jgi:serine O-acetyltransferase
VAATEGRGPEPRFRQTVLADARIAAAYRHERNEFRSRLDEVLQVLRLCAQTDAFLALVAYRAEARLRARGIPVLPWLARRVAMRSGQLSISRDAVVLPGLLVPHGHVVVLGATELHPFATLMPWVTVGPSTGQEAGPRIGAGAVVGTGAKVLGQVEVGPGARIGTNSVVLDDVPPGTTVVGMPAEAVTD